MSSEDVSKADKEKKSGKGITRSESLKLPRSGSESKISKCHDVDAHEELKRIMLSKSLEREMEQKGLVKSSDTPSSDEEQKGRTKDTGAESQPKGGVLKQVNDNSDSDVSEPRGILKKEGSFEAGKLELEKNVLKDRSFETVHEPEKGGLKEESTELPKSEPEKSAIKQTGTENVNNVTDSVKKEEIKEKSLPIDTTPNRVKDIKGDKPGKEKSPERQSSVERKLAGGCASAIRRRGRDSKQPERWVMECVYNTERWVMECVYNTERWVMECV